VQAPSKLLLTEWQWNVVDGGIISMLFAMIYIFVACSSRKMPLNAGDDYCFSPSPELWKGFGSSTCVVVLPVVGAE
jgi:hypothetical protein